MTIYMDNAATSWPKDTAMLAAMTEYLTAAGGNPGRSGHSMSAAAARIVFNARESIAGLFGLAEPERVVFTKNATESLNTILFGMLKPGDHVITSSMEHNAVMRPLRRLEQAGVALTAVACDHTGQIDPDYVRRAITTKTKLVVMTHASNVAGTILPIAEVGRIAKEAGVLYAVDAAQTAGSEDINMTDSAIDLLAFTGHKGLGGPQGTGGLLLAPGVEVPPLLFGGTGSQSESEYQPDFLPDRLESGTINAIGIAGLGAAINSLQSVGLENIRLHKRQMMQAFLDGLNNIDNIEIYGAKQPQYNAGVISLNIRGVVCSETGLVLDRLFGILTRTGLHCAPAAHKTMGTFPQGTVRFSIGRFTTLAEINETLAALGEIAAKAR